MASFGELDITSDGDLDDYDLIPKRQSKRSRALKKNRKVERADDNNENVSSVTQIFGRYLKEPMKVEGSYVRGYIDGEEEYKEFLDQFCAISRVKFTVRTSKKKKNEYCKEMNENGRMREG